MDPKPEPPLQLMLDSNLPDVLLDDDILRRGLRDLLEIHAAETYVTHVTVDEILRTPDPERRDRLILTLLAVGARLVPTSGFVLGTSRLDLAGLGTDAANAALSQFMEGNVRHLEDALIATTAHDRRMSLATAERSRGRLSRHLPALVVLSLQGLRDAVNDRLIREGRLDARQRDLVDSMQWEGDRDRATPFGEPADADLDQEFGE